MCKFFMPWLTSIWFFVYYRVQREKPTMLLLRKLLKKTATNYIPLRHIYLEKKTIPLSFLKCVKRFIRNINSNWMFRSQMTISFRKNFLIEFFESFALVAFKSCIPIKFLLSKWIFSNKYYKSYEKHLEFQHFFRILCQEFFQTNCH